MCFYNNGLTFWRWVNNDAAEYVNLPLTSGGPLISMYVELSKEGIYIDDEYINTARQTEWQDDGYGMSLFGFRNIETGEMISYGRHQVYSCQIYKDNILIRNFIPCLDENDRPCMYDTVSEQPFYNQGSGEEFLYKLK